MDGVCYLIGAGEHPDNIICRPDSDDYVIAVDGGYDYAVQLGITPNLIIGDFDSLEINISESDDANIITTNNITDKITNNITDKITNKNDIKVNNTRIPVISFPPEKDYTDMMLAAKKATKLGFRTILIYGGTGGRPDHTFANIQLLSWIAEQGCAAYLFDGAYTMTAIQNRTLNITAGTPDKHSGFITSDGYGYISIFSLSDISEGVTIKGLKYTACGITLNRFHALGTSNEFTDSDCSIEVKKGSLLIIAQTGKTPR